MVLALAGVAVVALAWAAWVWYASRQSVVTDDAYVDGTMAPIAAKVPGQVMELLERADQDLARALELFGKELVARQFVDHAEVEARAATAQLTAAHQRVTQAQRDVETAEADARMRESGFEPQQIGLRTAEARTIEARAQAIQAEALAQEVKVREAERELALAQLKQAEADLAVALLNLEYTEIRAPIPGLVSRRAVEVGQV